MSDSDSDNSHNPPDIKKCQPLRAKAWKTDEVASKFLH